MPAFFPGSHSFAVMRSPKRISSHATLPLQRELHFAESGRVHDLAVLFDKLNDRYFGGEIRGYTVLWGRRRKLRPKRTIVFGWIQEEDRVIRVHPELDREWVPKWFVEYVLYHEMCHAVVPDIYLPTGRRQVHHEAFWARERQFRFYRRAKAWESENLARFLR